MYDASDRTLIQWTLIQRSNLLINEVINMSRTFIWEMEKGKNRYKEFHNILVSSIRTENNGDICSLLKEGWEVLKIIIEHKQENTYYQYCLGKPDKIAN